MAIKIKSSRLTIVDHTDHYDIRIDYNSGQMELETDVCLDDVKFEVEPDAICVEYEQELVDIIHNSSLDVGRIITLLTPNAKTYTRSQVVKCFGSALRNLEEQ